MPRTAPASPVDVGALARGGDVSPEFERECVAFFEELMGALGVPPSYGQIYGLLFASPQPLSFTDIVQRLDISRGSASQGLQALRALGAVQKVGTDTDRRELFEPELRLRQLMGGLLREKVDPIVSGGAARMKTLRAHAEAAPTEAGREFSLERLRKLDHWRRQTGLLLPLLKTILGPGRA